MRLWRRAVVTSLFPCKHMVHMMLLTSRIPTGLGHVERVSFIEVRSSCPTVHAVTGPKCARALGGRRWTKEIDLPHHVFTHRGYTVPLCCRATIQGAWDALRNVAPR